jgi:hypothetical protein
MPPSLAFTFHFNQHTHQSVEIANRACYRGLLNVLLAHPQIKFNLHWSGTLLRALSWFDPETLDLARAGVAAGQFELLGSTYAQNIPYASDDWDNTQQIALHRKVLKETFGVAPTVFWNAERCWRQSLLPLMAEGGYRVVPVEPHILRAAGLTDPIPASTTLNEQSMTVVYDDCTLRDRFNYAAWSGRRAQLKRYLQGYVAHPRANELFVVYAEDAEAMGLWNWAAGYLPHAVWHYLDAALTDLEKTGAFVFRHLSEARPLQTLPTLPDGAAQWMNSALQRPDAPYHEQGFTDWFDFNQRSPKNAYFRRLFSVFRSRLQSLGSTRQDPGFPHSAPTAAGIFYRQAIENFCSHQYEFGCIGVGGRGYWGWENVRTSFMFARAAELADDCASTESDPERTPPAALWVEDVTGDGSDEQLFCNGRHLAVFTAYGARLLYWFDLREGRQHVGNALAVPPATFSLGSTKLPRVKNEANRWLPDTFKARINAWAALKRQETRPMRRHLPDWIWEREPAELTVYGQPAAPAGDYTPLCAQTGALAGELTLDGVAFEPDAPHDYRFEPGGLCYIFLPPDDDTFMLEKHIHQTEAGLRVQYVFDNRSDQPRRLKLRTLHELTPDYGDALGQGQAAYEFFHHAGRFPGIRNTRTGRALYLEADYVWTHETCQLNLLAYEVQLTFELEVAPRAQAKLALALSLIESLGH